jgi:CHAT domain-containing protein/Tfp pilus assembly protein PilF
VLLLAVAGGCRHAPTPDARFQHIREEMRHGLLDDALRDVDAACAKYQSEPRISARFRVLKAHVLLLRGSYNDALAFLNPDLPPDLAHSEVAVHRLMVQGLVYSYLQQYDRAGDVLPQAEALARSTGSAYLADIKQCQGILQIMLGHYGEAETAFSKALEIARRDGLPYLEADALGSLGNVAMNLEHYDQAIDRYKLALQKAQALRSLSSVSKTLGNLGWNYSVIGDFENAEASFKDALDTAAQAGLLDDQVYWTASLSYVYLQEERHEDAYATARKAADLAEKIDDKYTRASCLNTLSRAALATGHLDVAERANQDAAGLADSSLDPFNSHGTRMIAGRIAMAKKDLPGAQAAFGSIFNAPGAPAPLQWEAHALLAQAYAEQGQAAQAQREFTVAIRTFEAARNAIPNPELRLSFLSNAIAFYDAYVSFLIDQRRPLDALKVADLSRSQSFEQNPGPAGDKPSKNSPQPVFRPEDIAHSLNATLLFYWLGERRSWLWVVAPAQTSLVPLPPSAEIEAPVKSYRQAFLDPRDPLEAANTEGKKLYQTLVQPAEKFIPPDSRVIIFPDGSLNLLNFETLINPGCSEPCGSAQSSPLPHYWIDDVTITTASSLSRSAGGTMSVPLRNPNILIVGKSLPASPDFPPIGQAGREISYLEKYFSSERRLELTDGNAKPSAYLNSHPERFSFLHFTAHGTASRLQPLESAIILSPEGDSFKLYARDILQRPLAAYLVTISACNGSGIKTYAGEGLVGLSWAFLRAGAHNVIGGLWEVSNASTPQLMDELYKNLSAGQDPASALRNAKLTLVHSTGNYRKPFYWAPFLLYSGS